MKPTATMRTSHSPRYMPSIIARMKQCPAIFGEYTSRTSFGRIMRRSAFRSEADGHYENKSFAEVYAEHYSQDETMSGYLWGVYLTNFLWAHHAEIGVSIGSRRPL